MKDIIKKMKTNSGIIMNEHLTIKKNPVKNDSKKRFILLFICYLCCIINLYFVTKMGCFWDFLLHFWDYLLHFGRKMRLNVTLLRQNVTSTLVGNAATLGVKLSFFQKMKNLLDFCKYILTFVRKNWIK